MIRYDKIRYDMIYDTIFIYCKWVSTRWQWSVDLYKNRKETAQKSNNTQYNTKTQNTQNGKQKYITKNKHKKNIQNKVEQLENNK